jgi:hypothetical protein
MVDQFGVVDLRGQEFFDDFFYFFSCQLEHQHSSFRCGEYDKDYRDMRTLILNGRPITHKDLRYLLPALPHTLTHLRMSATGLDATCAALIAQWLKTNKTLCSLDVSCNPCMGIAGEFAISDMLEKNNTLLDLNISHCALSAVSTKRLLENAYWICVLDVSGNTIGYESKQVLVRLIELSARLECLYLNECGLTHGRINSILKALAKNSQILELSLDNNADPLTPRQSNKLEDLLRTRRRSSSAHVTNALNSIAVNLRSEIQRRIAWGSLNLMMHLEHTGALQITSGSSTETPADTVLLTIQLDVPVDEQREETIPSPIPLDAPSDTEEEEEKEEKEASSSIEKEVVSVASTSTSTENDVIRNGIEDWARCPITMEVMQDPVMAADGSTYDRKAIEMWLSKNNTSPVTNLPLSHPGLTPNNTLRSLILNFFPSK